MNNLLIIDVWTVILRTFVSIQATILAFVYEPIWKALILILSLPFTFATLALRRNVDMINMVGLLLPYGFTHAVRILYYTMIISIMSAVVISSLAYCAAVMVLVSILPRTSSSPWITITNKSLKT